MHRGREVLSIHWQQEACCGADTGVAAPDPCSRGLAYQGQQRLQLRAAEGCSAQGQERIWLRPSVHSMAGPDACAVQGVLLDRPVSLSRPGRGGGCRAGRVCAGAGQPCLHGRRLGCCAGQEPGSGCPGGARAALLQRSTARACHACCTAGLQCVHSVQPACSVSSATDLLSAAF